MTGWASDTSDMSVPSMTWYSGCSWRKRRRSSISRALPLMIAHLPLMSSGS